MVDNNLIEQLKVFIRKRFELVEQPSHIKPGKISFGKALEKIPSNMLNKPSTNTFEDIANTLTDFIKGKRERETFSTLLDKLREEKEMTPAQLYNGAWIKKQLYSKIMGERNYHPSKNTVIAFGLSLRLDLEGMDELLKSAGYRFSNSSISDLVILFCLDMGLYDLHNVNALLLSADQKVLCRE